jgi:hypothetical protein
MGETGSIQPSMQVTATEERSPLSVGQTMLYRGVEYEIEPIEPGVWKWQCRIGDRINTGKIKCKLALLEGNTLRSQQSQRPSRPAWSATCFLQWMTIEPL